MEVDEARQLLSGADHENPAVLTRDVLSKLTVEDVPEGASFLVGTRWEGGANPLDWGGKLRREGMVVFAEVTYSFTRRYWFAPLGVKQYLDLTRRAIETRHRVKGDIELIDYDDGDDDDDDDAIMALRFGIKATEKNLARAYGAAQKVEAEILEVADQALDEVGERMADIAARVSGWGSESLDGLVDNVEKAVSSDDKGRALEELCSQLFRTVPGFTVTLHIRTKTEEIDISVRNGSNEPTLRQEGHIILAECKNWTGKCGKDEFVLFHKKIENQKRRCRLGYLISWNGFAETVTSEMLRGSHEDVLVVPLEGKDIRKAVRTGDFLKVLLASWYKTVNL